MASQPRYAWVVLSFALLFQALSFGLVFYSFAVMVVPLQRAFEVSLSDIMLAAVVLQLGMGLHSAWLGRLIDHWPPHRCVALGGASLALGFVATAAGNNYWGTVAVYATLFPVGLVLAGSLAAQSLAVRWFPARRGLAIGLAALGTSIGGFVLPPLVSALIVGQGWQSTFMVLAGLCLLLICPLAWLLLRREPPPAVIASGAGSALEARLWTVREVLREPGFWLIVAGFSPVVAAFTAIQLNIGAYAQDHGIEPVQAAYLVSVIAVAMIAGKLFFAAQADRLSHRSLYIMIAAGHVLVILGLARLSEFYPIAILVALFGFTVGGAMPLVGAMVARRFGGRSFGRVMGLATPFITAGSALGPLLAAFLRDSTGSYGQAFSLFLYVLVPAAVMVGFCLKAKPSGGISVS